MRSLLASTMVVGLAAALGIPATAQDRYRDRDDDRYERRDRDDRFDREGRTERHDRGGHDDRYVLKDGRWWFKTSDGGWMYWQNGRWNRFVSRPVTTTRTYSYQQPQYYGGGYNSSYYRSGYRGYDNYYGNPYYGGGYGGGYYGRGGYYNGPGYGNRGWGNMNYGSRGANQGSNIGGMIDQSLGGSGWMGSQIGGRVGR